MTQKIKISNAAFSNSDYKMWLQAISLFCGTLEAGVALVNTAVALGTKVFAVKAGAALVAAFTAPAYLIPAAAIAGVGALGYGAISAKTWYDGYQDQKTIKHS